MKAIKVLLFAVLACVISACGTSTFSSADDLVSQALEDGVKMLPVEKINEIIQGEEIYNLIDVRQKSEHYHGYIPGSVVIPRGSLEFNIGSEAFWEDEGLYMPEKTEIMIVYCKKGKRSILAAQSLMNLGYKNVIAIEGGWKEWELNYPDYTEKNLSMLSGGNDDHADAGGC